MKIEKMKVSDLKYAPYNPRKIDDKELAKLKRSISEFGYVEPIVWNERTGFVVGGNQRLKALRELGIEEVDVVVVDLDDAKEKALNVALNKISGEWDFIKLKDVLTDIDTGDFDIELTGFDLDEIADLIAFDKEPEEDDFDADAAIDEIEEPKTKRGDIYLLGKHRLMCGDSTIREDVEKLMDGKKADMVFTDPPYGISVVKNNSIGGGNPVGGKKTGKIGGGHIVSSNVYSEVIGDDTTETAKKTFELCKTLGIENFIIFGGNYFADFLPPSRCWICWDKIDGMEGTTKNFSDIELAWTSYDKPARIVRHRWQGLMKGSERNQKRVHPTQKPIALVVGCFELFDVGEQILDLFGGSGSTLIACEQLNRICYMMELDEKYCDVIVRRWEEFTGKKAELIRK